MIRVPGTARAVGRSLRIYYGDPERDRAMDALYRRFVGPGGLAFDLGAHVGDRISSFRRLGARVVALEPQPGPARALRLIHGRDPHVTLIESAAGDARGEVRLHLNTANPTVSTLSESFVQAAAGANGWEGQVWDRVIVVPCLTLGDLIATHGRPDFVKIDVEGFEDRVLRGLNVPVAALSFEFTTIARDVSERCLDRLSALGDYRYNLALGETQEFLLETFVDATAMQRCLGDLPHAANSGDVYAVLN
jgi:FkbM family methyltransferase